MNNVESHVSHEHPWTTICSIILKGLSHVTTVTNSLVYKVPSPITSKVHREKDYVCKVGDCDHRTQKLLRNTMSIKNTDTWKIRTFSVISANAHTKHQANYQPIVTKCTELSREDN